MPVYDEIDLSLGNKHVDSINSYQRVSVYDNKDPLFLNLIANLTAILLISETPHVPGDACCPCNRLLPINIES